MEILIEHKRKNKRYQAKGQDKGINTKQLPKNK